MEQRYTQNTPEERLIKHYWIGQVVKTNLELYSFNEEKEIIITKLKNGGYTFSNTKTIGTA